MCLRSHLHPRALHTASLVFTIALQSSFLKLKLCWARPSPEERLANVVKLAVRARTVDRKAKLLV